MPIKIQAGTVRGSASDGSHSQAYLAWPYADRASAEAAVLASVPAFIDGNPVTDVTGEEYETLEDSWRVAVTWSDEDPSADPSTSDSSYSFEAGISSVNVKQSYGTTIYGTGAPDFDSNVLYDPKEDRYLGSDVKIPTFGFAETHYQPDLLVDTTYINTIYGMVGKYNNTSFRGFDAGEVLFLGAAGAKRRADLWEITYRFEGSPNLASISIGDITGIAKLGWQYLWALYGEGSGSGPTFVAPPVEGVYVEDLYQSGNMALLAIG